MIRPIVSLFRMPSARRALAGEALRELARAWALVRLRRFAEYAPGLGKSGIGDPEWEWSGDIQALRDVQWSVERLTRAALGRPTCLMKAMAGQRMLARRGIGSAIVLGVKPGATGADPTAHSWLRVGRWVVLGGDERAGHIPVTSYRSVLGGTASGEGDSA